MNKKNLFLILLSLTVSFSFFSEENATQMLYVPSISLNGVIALDSSIVSKIFSRLGIMNKKYDLHFIEIINLNEKKIYNRIISWYEDQFLDTENSFFYNLILWDGFREVMICTTEPQKYVENFSFSSIFYCIYPEKVDQTMSSVEQVSNLMENPYFIKNDFNINEFVNSEGALLECYKSNRNLISALIEKGYLVAVNRRGVIYIGIE